VSTVHAADMLVFESGKKMRVESYYVDEDRITVQINGNSEMQIPMDWVKEIRVLPKDRAPEPEVVALDIAPFEYSDLVQITSKKLGMDWKLVAAVMRAESNYNSRALSRKGAVGLMQLMPATATLYSVDPYDPAQNIEGGVRHLKMLMERYAGKLDLVLAAYNAGAKAVDHYRGIPPFDETRAYVKRVLQFYQSS